jgi:cholesterol oxidase
MVRQGHAVTMDGTTYLRNLERLAIPITFLHGENNRCFLPDSTQATFAALAKANGPDHYSRTVIPGYGDIDCIIGKNAARDVYPLILAHLRSPSVQPLDTAHSLGSLSSPAVLKL